MFFTEHLIEITALVLLCAAVVSDLRTHRIPNVLVMIMLVCGLSLQAILNGLTGVGHAALGVLVGLCVFIIPYIKGGMAAGDVKLLAATGSFLGPVLVLITGGVAMVAGASIAMTLLAYQRYRGANPTVEQMLTTRFPFAGAIAIGAAFSIALRGSL